MKLLEDRIRKDGVILSGEILKVDSFLNHQLDVPFLKELAKEFVRRYEGERITKVLTIEASGIAVAVLTAEILNVPAVFAKKAKTSNLGDDVYTAKVHSFTHGTDHTVMVSKKYLDERDRVLIIDDFLANGEALRGLIALCGAAGAKVAGCGVVIEKAFQPGGGEIRRICRVESLARVGKMSEKGVEFLPDAG